MLHRQCSLVLQQRERQQQQPQVFQQPTIPQQQQVLQQPNLPQHQPQQPQQYTSAVQDTPQVIISHIDHFDMSIVLFKALLYNCLHIILFTPTMVLYFINVLIFLQVLYSTNIFLYMCTSTVITGGLSKHSWPLIIIVKMIFYGMK